MNTILFNVYQKILVVGIPPSKIDKRFRELEKRGAVYAEPGSIRLNRNIPEGTEVVVMYKPEAVEPTQKDREQEDQFRLINELAGNRRIPCWSTPLLPSVLEFVSGRLHGASTNRGDESGHSDLPNKDYVESRAPAGTIFNIKTSAFRIRTMARADNREIGLEVIMKYLTRLRTDRRKRLGAPMVQKPERPVKASLLVNRRALREAPVVELPPDLAKQATRLAPVKLSAYVASLFRAELPFSNESYANAIQALAVKNGFPDADSVEICLRVMHLRRRAGSAGGSRKGLDSGQSETWASA